MQTIILTRRGVAIELDAGRQHVTRCTLHNHVEVWPTGALAAIASQPAHVADWCNGCAQARERRAAS